MLRAALSNMDPALPLSNVSTLDGDRVRFDGLPAIHGLAERLRRHRAGAGARRHIRRDGVSVSRQTAEIGVRIALGASHERVMRLIVRQGMKPVVIGIAAGLVAALLLSRSSRACCFRSPRATRSPMRASRQY